MAVTPVSKSPQQLLQDMWDLLSREVDDLKARREHGVEADALEDSSKQLQRLIANIRGAIKDSAEYEAKQRADAGNLSDADIIPALLKDPGYRGMVIKGLEGMGWAVTEPSFEPTRREKKVKVMRAPAADPAPPKPKPKRHPRPGKEDFAKLLSAFEAKKDE
jgi:hypothetical protein